MKWNNKDHRENQKVENRNKVKINKPKMYIFEEVDKVDNIYPGWWGKKNEEPDCQRNKRDVIMIESTGFKEIIKKLYKQCFANNSNNLSEMDKFLER